MTKIQRVLRDIKDLQDFSKKTKSLRLRIKIKGLERSKVEQKNPADAKSRAAD